MADATAKSMLDAPTWKAPPYTRHNPVVMLKAAMAKDIATKERPRSFVPSSATWGDDPKKVYDMPDWFGQRIALWLRTGHSPLNKHLHRTGQRDSPNCSHCHTTPEGRRHFLLECPQYQAARERHIYPLLQFNTTHSIDPNSPQAVEWILHSNQVHGVIQFTKATGRFRQ